HCRGPPAPRMCARAPRPSPICRRSVAHRRAPRHRRMLDDPRRRHNMFIRSAIATAVLAAMTAACTPPQTAKGPAVNDKTYAVTPGAVTMKQGVLSGALSEMKVIERVEDGSGRVDQPARLTGKLVLTNVSKDQSLRLLGGKLLYIDMQGKPIPLED